MCMITRANSVLSHLCGDLLHHTMVPANTSVPTAPRTRNGIDAGLALHIGSSDQSSGIHVGEGVGSVLGVELGIGIVAVGSIESGQFSGIHKG